jgi:predicted DNA-binding WGR domain protein
MRPRLLGVFGWEVESVLGKDWYENPEGELTRLISVLQGNKSQLEDGGDDKDSYDDDFGENDHGQTAEVLGEPPLDDLQLEVRTDADSLTATTSDAQNRSETVPPSTANGSKRRFEFQEGNSNKFWEIIVNGCEHTVRYGRIGSSGQSQTKSFPSEADTERDANRLIAEKTRKGYREIG